MPPPQKKPPKAKDNTARKQQALDMARKKAKERLPHLKDEDVEVWSATPAPGDGDWRAVVVINGPEREIQMVGYNYETEQIYIDRLGRSM